MTPSTLLSVDEKAARKHHTKRMFAWRGQVRGDGEITDFQYRVADGIAECSFYTTDCAEVTQADLLKKIGRGTRRGLQKALHALRDHGHLRIEERNLSCECNRYWPVIFAEDVNEASDDSANPGSYYAHEPRFADSANEGSHEVRTTIRTSLLKTSEKPSEKDICLGEADDAQESLFAEGQLPEASPFNFGVWWEREFWPHYPLKVDEIAAKRLCQATIGGRRSDGLKATPNELVNSVLRFSNAMTGREDKYILSPTKWLQNGRWTDKYGERTGGGGGRMSVIEEILRAGEEMAARSKRAAG